MVLFDIILMKIWIKFFAESIAKGGPRRVSRVKVKPLQKLFTKKTPTGTCLSSTAITRIFGIID